MFQKRIIAMFLCVLMVFTAVSCAIPDVDSDTTEGGETTSNLTTLNLTDKFVVVRSEKADSDTIAAGMLLIKAVKDIFGFYLEYKDDWARTEADIKPHEYEIVVGKTNREASRQFNDTMTILDYTYLIASEKQIVIYGKCGESALSATRKFLSDFFGYDEELGTGEKSTLEINKSYVFKNTYEYDVLEFNNIKANEYTVVTENLNKTQALILADTVEKMCGVGIPVVNFKDFGGGNAIYVGIGDEGKNLYYYGEYEYLFTAKHALGKSSIIIDATNKQLAVAVNEFIENYLPQNKNDSVNIQVAVDKEVFGYTCLSDLNGVTFVSETKETLASGIVYSTKIYKDKDGKPVIGSVLTIEPNSAKLLTGTPNDGTQITGVHATVLNQMKSAVANNKNVIAGINADFFDMGGMI